MIITRKEIADMLIKYINREIDLAGLIDWAEEMMMEAEFDRVDFDTIREIIGRLGLADVRAFGITWEECEEFLSQLGYQVKVTIQERLVPV